MSFYCCSCCFVVVDADFVELWWSQDKIVLNERFLAGDLKAVAEMLQTERKKKKTRQTQSLSREIASNIFNFTWFQNNRRK